MGLIPDNLYVFSEEEIAQLKRAVSFLAGLEQEEKDKRDGKGSIDSAGLSGGEDGSSQADGICNQ